MSAIATAIVGTAVVGGIVSSKAADSAAEAQEQATAAASKAADDQLAFQKQQYQEWQDVYGPIQDNLAEFYQNYDAEEVTSLGLQNIEREYNQSKDSLIQEMAQRGMDTSGLTASSLTALSAVKAAEKATIRSQAPLQAAQAQQSFLGMGLGLESSLQQGIAGAYGSQIGVQQRAADIFGQQAAAGAAGVGSAIAGVGTGIATYAQMQAMQGSLAAPAAGVIPSAPAITPTYIPQTSTVTV